MSRPVLWPRARGKIPDGSRLQEAVLDWHAEDAGEKAGVELWHSSRGCWEASNLFYFACVQLHPEVHQASVVQKLLARNPAPVAWLATDDLLRPVHQDPSRSESVELWLLPFVRKCQSLAPQRTRLKQRFKRAFLVCLSLARRCSRELLGVSRAESATIAFWFCLLLVVMR